MDGQLSNSDILYLITVYEAGLKGYIRSVDIAAILGFAKASITRAMARLESYGFINKDKYRFILLTEYGKETGKKYFDAVKFVQNILVNKMEIERYKAFCEARSIICDMEKSIFDKLLLKVKEV